MHALRKPGRSVRRSSSFVAVVPMAAALFFAACSEDGISSEESSETEVVPTSEATTTSKPPTTEALADRFSIEDATGALLLVEDLPSGWENLAPAQSTADFPGVLLLACGETVEDDIGVADLGTVISHWESATQIQLNHSIRIQEIDSAIELLRRTDDAAASCDSSWQQEFTEGEQVYDVSLADPPVVADRGDDTSVYATLTEPVSPETAALETALVQLRCGPIISRMAVTAFGPDVLTDTLVDDIAGRAFGKLRALAESAGQPCG